MVMWLKIQWFGIWVPLFLLWAIALVLLLLIMPLVFIGMAIVGRISRFWVALRLVVVAYAIVCALRGLQIEIHKEDQTFEIYLP
jgi:hypothetical protein